MSINMKKSRVSLKKQRLPGMALMFLCLTNTLYGQSDAVEPEHQQLLENYCSECHNFDDFAGGLAFDLLDINDLLSDAETWEKVLLKLKAGMMPPLGKERPDNNEVQAFVADMAHAIDSAWSDSPNTGAPLLHRMNRTEYQNAIRDLLALPIDAAEIFPADNSSEGFDNIASALSVLSGPDAVLYYCREQGQPSRCRRYDCQCQKPIPIGQIARISQHIWKVLRWAPRGGAAFEHVFPLDAEYEFSISRTGANARFLPSTLSA